MTPIDPVVADAVRAVLGFAPGNEPTDLAAAAMAANEAAAACRLDGGSLLLLAVTLVRQVRAKPGDPTVQGARRALGQAWPLASNRDLADLTACLLVICASCVPDARLALVEQIGRELE